MSFKIAMCNLPYALPLQYFSYADICDHDKHEHARQDACSQGGDERGVGKGRVQGLGFLAGCFFAAFRGLGLAPFKMILFRFSS
jgi:hypothetical protein